MDESLSTKRRISDLSKLAYSSLSVGTYVSSSQKIDNRPPVVIEIGKRLTRIGFAGEFLPRDIFLTKYVDPLSIETQNVFDKNYTKSQQHFMLVKFFKDIVFRFIHFFYFFKFIFRKLLTTINERRLVIIESVLTPTNIRNAIAKAFFECPSLLPHSILFAPSHLLCTFPFNTKNCLVVDVGVEETVMFPIAEGCLMLNSYETTTLAVRAVEENVELLLRKHARIRNAILDPETQTPSLRPLTNEDFVKINKFNIIEDIIVRFCFATTMERGHKIQEHFLNESLPIPPPPPDVELPFGTDMLIVPGFVREAVAEILFIDNSCDNRSIAQVILDIIIKSPIDMRRVFLSNLLIIGGLTRMKGFLSRLKYELLRLIQDPNEEYNLRLSGLSEVAFYRFKNDVNLELYCSWLGGSMFGICDALESRSISREDWLAQKLSLRSVPDWTNRIDDYFKESKKKVKTRQ